MKSNKPAQQLKVFLVKLPCSTTYLRMLFLFAFKWNFRSSYLADTNNLIRVDCRINTSCIGYVVV